MKIRFSAAKACVLKINGAYFGTVGAFERFAELSLQDGLFAECIPESGVPVCFFLNETLTSAPPPRVEVYLLRDGLHLHIQGFCPTDFSLTPLAQYEGDGALVTLFRQGETQVSVQTKSGAFVLTIPPSFDEHTEIYYRQNVVLLKTKEELCALSNKAELLFLERISDFSLSDNALFLTLPLSDRLGRFAKAKYALFEGKMEREEFSLVLPTDGKDEDELSQALLPYAFFESVLIGANFEQFLDPALKENAPALRSFLGEFCGVCFTERDDEIALITKRKERLYELRYFLVECENSKITDIKG